MGKNGLKIQEFSYFLGNHATKLGLFLPCFPVLGLLLGRGCHITWHRLDKWNTLEFLAFLKTTVLFLVLFILVQGGEASKRETLKIFLDRESIT